MVDRRFFLKGNGSRRHARKLGVTRPLCPPREGTSYDLYQERGSQYPI